MDNVSLPSAHFLTAAHASKTLSSVILVPKATVGMSGPNNVSNPSLKTALKWEQSVEVHSNALFALLTLLARSAVLFLLAKITLALHFVAYLTVLLASAVHIVLLVPLAILSVATT